MDTGDGMVAVVRGMPDAALTVTLLEGRRKYTLVPTAAVPPGAPPAVRTPYIHIQQRPHSGSPPLQHAPSCSPPSLPQHLHHRHYNQPELQHHQPQPQLHRPHLQHVSTDSQDLKPFLHCSDSSAQAVDGRYASIYKMEHCHVQPTSPEVELTEFPPQRVEPCRGHGNFVVGGLGSGETRFSPTRTNGSFRGGMSWPDRGSVFAARGSHSPDAFANSLRKYPTLSPDRSSEIIERLINYTQNKNVTSQQSGRSQGSPTRSESCSSGQQQYFDRRTYLAASLRCQRLYDTDMNCNTKSGSGVQSVCREISRRDRDAEGVECRRALFSRNYEVRHLRDSTRRAKGTDHTTYPYSHPVCPNIEARYDHLPPAPERKPVVKTSQPTNFVNMETQAEIVMVSREVATLPREKISKRNVAVPESPCSSPSGTTHTRQLRTVSNIECSCNSTQTSQQKLSPLNIRKSTHSCSSLEMHRDKKHHANITSRSKSQEHARIDADRTDNLLLLIKKELGKCGDRNKKQEILPLLSHVLNAKKHETVYFVNSVVYNLKEVLNTPAPAPSNKTRSHTLLVIKNAVQDSCMQTIEHYNKTDHSTEEINEQDIENNLKRFNRQLVQEINNWMGTIDEVNTIDVASKGIVADELAGDVIDRHKYLELNPECTGSDIEELEHLKYQIFKRLNKLVGEDNLNPIGHASELMTKLKTVPVPMLTKPVHSIDTNLPCSALTNYWKNDDFKCDTRRLCSPIETSFQKHENSKRKALPEETVIVGYMEEKKRQSSPPSCGVCSGSTPTPAGPHSPSLGPTTPNIQESNHFIHQQFVPPTNQRTPAGVSDPQRVPMLYRPRAASVNEAPKVTYPGGRRVSSPPNYIASPGAMVQNTGQAPPTGPSLANIEERPATTIQPPCGKCQHSSDRNLASENRLKEQFDEFVKNWAQQIPINTSKLEEVALIDKMRLGIYKGAWIAITKLLMNPVSMNNEFYYRDILDDEIEELLNLLPESPELTNCKQILKNQLIEKTMSLRAQILATGTTTSYKQQLVETVVHNISRRTMDLAGEDVDQLIEEVHRFKLADDFIMYTAYREHDRVKANVYKQKLEKHVQEMFEEIKKSQGREIKDAQIGTYRDDIMKALYKVPLPSDETIREEAEEILIGFEIEQWFADLPVHPTIDYVDSFCRRRYRNILAKKLHELDKQLGLFNCEDQVKQEIYKFMERVPLKPREAENVHFMVNELVNRIKNRPTDLVAGSVKSGRTEFASPNDYDEFSRDMQLCSTFSPNGKKAQVNESSYMIVGGERAGTSYACGGPHVQSRRIATPESQQQWYTLEETKIPPEMLREISSRKDSERHAQAIPSSQMRGAPFAQSQLREPTCAQPQTREPHFAQSQTQEPPLALSQMREPLFTLSETQEPPITQSENRESVAMQSGPSVRIQEQAVQTGPSSYYPCGEKCTQARGSLTRGSQSPRTLTQTQSEVPVGAPPASAGSGSASDDAGTPPVPSPSHAEGSTAPCRSTRVQTGESAVSGETGRRVSAGEYSVSGAPVGYSTPQPSCREPRLRRRVRPVEADQREEVRRRLDAEDTEDSSNYCQDGRCRCMERVRRCRKTPMPFICMSPGHDHEFDMDYPPYFPMRMACPYYY